MNTEKKLYVWNWKEGGFNQMHAYTPEEVLSSTERISSVLTIDEKTLRALSKDEESQYWTNFPLLD